MHRPVVGRVIRLTPALQISGQVQVPERRQFTPLQAQRLRAVVQRQRNAVTFAAMGIA